MATDKYKIYASRASDELSNKQDLLLIDYGIGTFADFLYDQTTGKIAFMDDRGIVRLDADVTPIGSFSCRTKTWLWAWSNESVLPGLRVKAAILRELGKVTKRNLFDKPKFKASETKAWELAAICVRYLGSSGCYRIPHEHMYVFLALDNIRKRRSSKKSRRATKRTVKG